MMVMMHIHKLCVFVCVSVCQYTRCVSEEVSYPGQFVIVKQLRPVSVDEGTERQTILETEKYQINTHINHTNVWVNGERVG